MQVSKKLSRVNKYLSRIKIKWKKIFSKAKYKNISLSHLHLKFKHHFFMWNIPFTVVLSLITKVYQTFSNVLKTCYDIKSIYSDFTTYI